MLTTLVAFIIVLGVLVFVHELGHFVTAKLVDIEVPRFSIGLGPKLWGFRRGETEYVISWLPLGGYVKMAGMEELEAIEGGAAEPESETTGLTGATDLGLVQESEGRRPKSERTFESKSLPARMLVISAGVIMNVIFAFLVFAGSAWVLGVERPPEARVPAVPAEHLPPGAEALASVPPGSRVVAVGGRRVENSDDLQRALLRAKPGPVVLELVGGATVTLEVPSNDTAKAELIGALGPVYPPVIGRVVEGEPAAAAGLQAGDRVLAVDGEPIGSWPELVTRVQARPGQPLDLDIERGGQTLTIRVVPVSQTIEAGSRAGEEIGRIGAIPEIVRDRPGLAGAAVHGARRTAEVTGVIIGFLVDLFTGDASPRALGGPILIGQLSGEMARAGLADFLNFMALFSINLAVLNLLPIPVLDGGQLLFLGIEAVRGRALSLEQRMRLSQVGLVIIVAIMVWAFANDVLRLFGL